VVAIHHPFLLGTLLSLCSFARGNNDQHAIVGKRETNTHRKIKISKKEPERNGKDGRAVTRTDAQQNISDESKLRQDRGEGGDIGGGRGGELAEDSGTGVNIALILHQFFELICIFEVVQIHH